MPELRSPEEFLAASASDPVVYALRSDYRVLLLVVDGVEPEAASSSVDDVCNVISVLHQIPSGGEDFHRYVGSARLMRAIGEEPFDAVANDQPQALSALASEVRVSRRLVVAP